MKGKVHQRLPGLKIERDEKEEEVEQTKKQREKVRSKGNDNKEKYER